MTDTGKKKGVTVRKKLWIGVAVLVLLSPLGVVLPALLGSGGAWGEWGLDEIERIAGFLPRGMKHLAELWRSPMPDYTLPGQNRGLVEESAGYFVTAAIGVAITAAAGWFLAKVLGRRERKERNDDRNSLPGTPERE